jgi:aquaporin Z
VGGTPLSQLWLFWAAQIIGGVLGGVLYKWLGKD